MGHTHQSNIQQNKVEVRTDGRSFIEGAVVRNEHIRNGRVFGIMTTMGMRSV